MDLNSNVDPSIVKLSNFSRALALPVRIYIIRQILDNHNCATREILHQIPFKKDLINMHLLELKNMGLLKTTHQNRIYSYTVDENKFIAMSNSFLDLFAPIAQFNNDAIEFLSRPRLKKKKQVKIIDEIAKADDRSFGKYLREKRRAAGFNQTQVAQSLDICRKQLSRIESGRTLLRPEKIKSLATLLEVPLDEMAEKYYQCSVMAFINKNEPID
jgi:DNA-binding XRE family transcriptional regulator